MAQEKSASIPQENSSTDFRPRKCRIEIEGARPVFTPPGHLFLDVLNRHGFDLHNDCGGFGKCGKCKIIFRSDPPQPLKGDLRHLDENERRQGVRLACFHPVSDNCRIEIPPAPATDLLDDLSD